jgi:hypothetical protein
MFTLKFIIWVSNLKEISPSFFSWKKKIYKKLRCNSVKIRFSRKKILNYAYVYGPLPKWCLAVALSCQDGRHSAVALLLKAALIQVSDYRLLGASGFRRFPVFEKIWIIYQNMPNLHNRYKSAERKISKKNPEHMLNYSLPCSCSSNLSSFWLILKQLCPVIPTSNQDGRQAQNRKKGGWNFNCPLLL